MAAKKKTKAAPKKAAPKKAVAKKAPAPAKTRLAVKLLGELPPLDERRRRVFRLAFTDEQCKSWGDATKAAAVLGEAERFISELNGALKKAAPTGYSRYRLSWLASLVNELEDAVDADSAGPGEHSRVKRAGAIEVADKARKKLVNALLAASSGDARSRKQVTDRNESSKTPHALESTLTGLLQLAVQLRRTDDGEVLADEVGLTEAFLSSVSGVIESLRAANEATYDAPREQDSIATNLIEGRVLREMAFANTTFHNAREAGEAVSALRPGPNLSRFVSRGAKEDEAIPDPDKTPPPA